MSALALLAAALEVRDQELAKLRQIVASYERDAKADGEASAPTLKGILLEDFRKLQERVHAMDRALEVDAQRIDAIERELGLLLHQASGSLAQKPATRLDQVEMLHVERVGELQGQINRNHVITAEEDAKLEARVEKRLAAIERKLRPVRKARKAARK